MGGRGRKNSTEKRGKRVEKLEGEGWELKGIKSGNEG